MEEFDPAFFNITPGEAETLRPNTRLALELTWEALERAGVPPSSLRGKNVSTFIAMGAEDGWDTRRYIEDGPSTFNHHWAANTDPSGVSGRVAHFFDFRGPTATISSACSSAASALREGQLFSKCKRLRVNILIRRSVVAIRQMRSLNRRWYNDTFLPGCSGMG